jgi:glycosyltransferase involved in cell wall biosynthesis
MEDARMNTPDGRRPRLAVIVANGITGDSRVQKVAVAGARAGYDVTLIGSAVGDRGTRATMGPIEVLRVPVGNAVRRKAKGHRIRRYVTQFGIKDRAVFQASFRAWERDVTARRGWLLDGTRGLVASAPSRLAAKALGATARVGKKVYRFRLRAYGWEEAHGSKPRGDWRRDWPYLVDLDLAFGPVIEDLKPDLIHANDVTMIGVAAMAVGRMRARGEKVAWLYDAHEYVSGVDWRRPALASAMPALEREFIGRADAVTTVSPLIAERLQHDYQLPTLPLVLGNTPVRECIGQEEQTPSVRDVCGLGSDVPLLVYSGWVDAGRGLLTAVKALPNLPGFHLAIVAGRSSADLDSLLETAQTLGVRDRVHVVPYVAQHAVPDYLSTADAGIICLQRKLSYELSLPTKVAEYLHGGLPVISSDVRTLREFLEATGVGEVFVADDSASFADAAQRALANRDKLRANISEDILTELSWEYQSAGLIKLYEQISPVKPQGPVDVPWSVQEKPVVTPASDQPRSLAGWRSLSATQIRLGLGPANYAGQAAAFAGAICADRRDVSAEVMMWRSPSSFNCPADVYIDTSRLRNVDLQVEQVQRIIGRYSHLIVDAFLPVFGLLNGDSIADDLPALHNAKIKIALLAHGSEIRHPARHLERYEYSLFHDAPPGVADNLTGRVERNKRVAESSGLPLFVTTPDLLEDLPSATWAPLVVDVDTWSCNNGIMVRPRPVVLHAPSRRWTKGTGRILPVLREMEEQGLIELQLAEGVDNADLMNMVKDADIVCDQFTTGSYGTFAVEAMAAGKPVIATISETVLKATGGELPIVSATAGALREAITSLLGDPDRARRIGAASTQFAREYHDGRRTSLAFTEFLH